ncbi:hypothetical protein Tco_0979724 [Tanacetum coccineum]
MESQSDSTQTVSSLKLPMLKTGDYDLWSMRMEKYFTHTDYALWEVIVNGDALAPVPKEAIKTRFEGNKESNKMQKTILKQQYENFTASRSEVLHKIYDRFQKLINQLEIQGEVISQEDVKLKLLRSLPPAWNNIALIMRNKPDLDELSMDDLYNNLKVYEAKIKSQSSSNSNSQNVAFVSSKNTSSFNEAVNTALDVSTASTQGQASSSTYADDVMFSFFVNQSKSPLLDNEDMEQIDSDDLEEMDLKWQVAMLTMRIKRFIKKTRRNLNLNGKEAVGLDMTKVKCYNYHMKGHFARDYRAPKNQGNRNRDNARRVVPVETSTNALVVQDGIGGYDWSFQDEDGLTNFALMAYTSQGSSSSDTESNSVKDKTRLGFDSYVNESEVLDNVVDSHECDQLNDRFKKSEGYHAVPPPYNGNFKPARADLSFAGLDDSVYKSKVSETITSMPNVETTTSKTGKDSLKKPKNVRPSALIIEDWESDSEDENVFAPKEVTKTVKSSFEKIEFVNARNSIVEKPMNFSQNPKDNKRNRNGFEFTKKACFVCGSFNHLIKDCDFHDKKMVQKHVLNNVKKRTAVLTKSGIVLVSAARPINTAAPKPFVNVARTRPNAFHKSHSTFMTPFNQLTALKNRNLNDKVNTAKVNSINTTKVNSINTAKGNKVTSAVGKQ